MQEQLTQNMTLQYIQCTATITGKFTGAKDGHRTCAEGPARSMSFWSRTLMLHRHQVVWMGLQTIYVLYDVIIYFILHVSRLVGKGLHVIWKVRGTAGCLEPFWLKPSSLSPLLVFLPPSSPWSPLRGDGGGALLGFQPPPLLLFGVGLVGVQRCSLTLTI